MQVYMFVGSNSTLRGREERRERAGEERTKVRARWRGEVRRGRKRR